VARDALDDPDAGARDALDDPDAGARDALDDPDAGLLLFVLVLSSTLQFSLVQTSHEVNLMFSLE